MIAPLPLVLRSQNFPAKIVYIGNRHESTFVVRKDLRIPKGQFQALVGKKIAVPLRYSGHNIALRLLLKKFNLNDTDINIVELQPPDMPGALQSGTLDGYFVGEPFAAKSIESGSSTVLYYVEDIWPGFMCNVMIVNENFIKEEPELVRKIVHSAIRANYWVKNHLNKAEEIASLYWGQKIEIVKFAMETPKNRVVFDRYTPIKSEIKQLFDYMVEFKLIDKDKEWIVDQVFDDSFAKTVNLDGITDDVSSILEK
jgi:NitT/TauT family transport system substrate-binding protein